MIYRVQEYINKLFKQVGQTLWPRRQLGERKVRVMKCSKGKRFLVINKSSEHRSVSLGEIASNLEIDLNVW